MAIIEVLVRVECDECSKDTQVELTSLVDVERKLLAELKEQDEWGPDPRTWRRGRHLCDECLAKLEDAE